MRAHFQNEHVGQNDLVKTCPLCNYRAGTMKSLRIHFFNRHGIDLDNPGPNAPSSLLLALDPTNASNYLPSFALAAAAAAAAANNSSLSLSGNNGGNSNSGPSYSDSGDSLQVGIFFSYFILEVIPNLSWKKQSPILLRFYLGFIAFNGKWNAANAFSYTSC